MIIKTPLPPPDHLTCDFCKEDILGSHFLDASIDYANASGDPIVRYSCPNHKPLIIDYTLFKITKWKNENWISHRIYIYYDKSFRLFWSRSFQYKVFYLQEFHKAIPDEQVEGWYIFNATSFPFEWVISQTPQRLLSILEMCRTFG